jgi:hypothetical protein
MSLITKSLAPISDNATDFGNWVWGASSTLTSLGWSRQENNFTNQAAITNTPTAGTPLPYWDVWTNGTSSLMPIYFKCYYGTESTSNLSNAYMGFQVGTGDSSGTLTGATSMLTIPNLNNNSATLYNCYFSGDGVNRLGIWMFKGFASQFMFLLERAQDANGNYVDGYFTAIYSVPDASTNGVSMVEVYKSGGAGSVNLGLTLPYFNTWTTTANGGSVALLPIFPIVGRVDNPLTIGAALLSAEAGDNASFAATIYNQTMNYIGHKTNSSYFSPASGTANYCPCMRVD